MEYFIWDLDPEIFRLGSFGPRYYGLMFALGFLVGYQIMTWVFRVEKRKEEDLSSLLFYLMVGTIVGARLGHCFFYDPLQYLKNPLEILFIWKGGLASHGGSIGVIIAIFLYCRKHLDQPPMWLIARLSAPVAFAAGCIRTGNFFNSEIIGVQTDLPWAVIFKRVDSIPRHPSMLYEALVYFVLFLILFVHYYKKRDKMEDGIQFGILLVGAWSSRFLIEFVKENQVTFENDMWLNMGQLLSIPIIIIGIIFLFGWYKSLFPFLVQAPVFEKEDSKGAKNHGSTGSHGKKKRRRK